MHATHILNQTYIPIENIIKEERSYVAHEDVSTDGLTDIGHADCQCCMRHAYSVRHTSLRKIINNLKGHLPGTQNLLLT